MIKKILVKISLLVAASLLLSSCSAILQPIPQSSLSEFSSAVSVTAENNMAAYSEIEKVHQEIELMKTVAEFDSKGFKPEEMKPFFDNQALKVRRQVLDGLCLYAEKLSAIAGEKQFEEFDAETKELGGSLQDLNGGLLKSSFFRNYPIESSHVQIFTTAVNAIGKWIIECKKDKTVRESLVGMDDSVSGICRLFIQDFGNPPDGLHRNPGGLRAQEWNQYDELMMLQDRFVGDNRSKLNPVDKKAEIGRLAALPRRQREADAVLSDIQNSFKKIQEIHAALAKEAAGEKQDCEKMLKKLVAEAKRISKFYKSVKE